MVIILIFLLIGLVFIVKLIHEHHKLNNLYGKCENAGLLHDSSLAEKNKPIFYISKDEPASIKNVFYQTFKCDSNNEIAVEYWLEWNESKAHFLSKLLGYGIDHKFEIEPIIIYLKDNKISHIAYTSGHYSRGTVLSNEIIFENQRPVFSIREGDHAYVPKKKSNYELNYELRILNKSNKKRIITNANLLAKELKKPFERLSKKYYDISINKIINNPWNFGKTPNDNFLVSLFSLFKGDITGMMFVDIQEEVYKNESQ